jgi:hypothetical protein
MGICDWKSEKSKSDECGVGDSFYDRLLHVKSSVTETVYSARKCLFRAGMSKAIPADFFAVTH